MERQTVTFERKQKRDSTGKKISTSIRVNRAIHKVALETSDGNPFDSVNDFYETGAKLMMLLGKGRFGDIKRFVQEQST